jgi:hypothetical protein
LNLLNSCVVLWKCPACTLSIAHSEAEAEPRPGVTYRCHICRLELILNETTDKLSMAPLSEKTVRRKKPSHKNEAHES